jgi:AcrR family transcriptional regulator
MVYRPTPRTAERKEARRRLFLATAVRLFGEHGYAATTVPMIVEAAGSSTGAFYLYFKNKEDVFAAAMQTLDVRISEAVGRAIAAETNPLLQMKSAVEGLFLFLAGNPGEARILIVESSGLSERLERVRNEGLASHARAVEAALASLAPRVAPQRPAVTARCWVGAVYHAAWWWLEQPATSRAPAAVVAAEVAAFNLRGIGADAAGIAAAGTARGPNRKHPRK